METSPLKVRALRRQGSQTVALDIDAAVAAVQEGGDDLVWVHVEVSLLEAALPLLKDRLGFHELAIEDALSDQERPALLEYPDELFLVAPALERRSGQERYHEVAFFLRAHALVTVCAEPCPVIEVEMARWERRPGPGGGSTLLHRLLDALVDEYFPAIDVIEDEVEDLAERVFNGDTGQVRSMLGLKRRLLEVRRRMGPLRDVLNGLLRHDLDVIEPEIRPYLQDVFDHALRVVELVEINRETMASLLDVHLSTVSNNLNNVVKKMTVISTMLMSAALVAGVYGMNFERMPELKWMYGYPFALGLMVVVQVLVVVAFRWKKWI